MSLTKETTYNMIGNVRVAVHNGEPVDLSKIFDKPLELHIDGDNFNIRIEIIPPYRNTGNAVCRLGLVIRDGT